MHLSCLFICLAKTDLSEQSIGRERIFFSSLYLCIYVSISLARSLARALSLCLSLTRAFSLLFALSLSLSLSLPPAVAEADEKGGPGVYTFADAWRPKGLTWETPFADVWSIRFPGDERERERVGGRESILGSILHYGGGHGVARSLMWHLSLPYERSHAEAPHHHSMRLLVVKCSGNKSELSSRSYSMKCILRGI